MVFKGKPKAILPALLLMALVLAILAPAAHAQDYSFSVPEYQVDVYLEQDGTAYIVYDLTFAPDPGSHAIDVVDVGMPNDTYRVSDIQASVDGVPSSRAWRSNWAQKPSSLARPARCTWRQPYATCSTPIARMTSTPVSSSLPPGSIASSFMDPPGWRSTFTCRLA
jgi:hypothetical protein